MAKVKIDRFEDLIAWQKTRDLTNLAWKDIYDNPLTGSRLAAYD